MENKKKEVLYSLLFAFVIGTLSISCWLNPSKDFSVSERRALKQFPEFSLATLTNGRFMTEFEDYTLDQFPLREQFRTLKAAVKKYILFQSDNNEVYLANGHISKLDYPLSETAINNALDKFASVYKNYIKDSDAMVYYSIIPDKNYFLADKNGYLAINYDSLYSRMEEELDYMNYIEIRDLLTIEDYYSTDTHWKQENILDVAKRLALGMETSLEENYNVITLETPFYGVYYGQLALPVEPDKISYLGSPIFDTCMVYDFENQTEIPIYDLSLAEGRDPYEMYLSGALSVITIENPNATTDKELVIFRDSFGSSLAPLLVEGYSKITLLDIRYLNENMIENFVSFTNQDVLFLYSTGVINNPTAFY